MVEIIHTSNHSFPNDVLQATNPVLLDFTATWCGPCKMLDPVVQQLAKEWGGKVTIYKVDVDENPDLVSQYQIMSVPTLLLFIKGQPVERISGFNPKDKIIDKLSPFLRS